jgi:hypothetical protein
MAAGKLAAVAAYAGPEPDPDGAAGIAARGGEPDLADCEIGAALRTSSRGGQVILATARALARMPATAAAFAAAELTFGHMLQLVDRTDGLTAEETARVEALALPKAARQGVAEFGQTVRRAIARVNPDHLKKKEREARTRTGVDVSHGEDGHATIHAQGPSLGASKIDAWLDAASRTAKAAGDTRSLSALRWAALVDGAETYLDTHSHTAPAPAGAKGAPASGPADRPARGTGPTSHGRAVTINLTMDLPTYLGLTEHPGEILGTGALIPADVIRALFADNPTFRRLITDPMTGHLLDYGRSTYRLPADLAAHNIARDITSTAPGATVPAARCDQDHQPAWTDGGRTDPDHTASVNRHWHRAKTLGGWTVTQNPDHTWTWTSPAGLQHTTEPHDYRLGP